MTNTPNPSGITVRYTEGGIKVEATGAAALEFLCHLADLPAETRKAKQPAAMPATDKDAAMKLDTLLAGSPTLLELQRGLRHLRAEWRRVWLRVRLRRELTYLDREEERAVNEVEWRKAELEDAQGNLIRLQVVYANRRAALRRRLEAAARSAEVL